METIAIIEDDIYIGDLLEKVLQQEGYQTLRAYSGTEARLLLAAQHPDLILLDLMLPGLSGEELLPGLQGIPVIVVSAKAGIDDKVALLMGGAVDYITKPFDTRELLARVAVHLRRPLAQAEQPFLYHENLELNIQTHELFAEGNPVRLTRTEFAILKLLMLNPDKVVPKSRILDLISQDTPDCTESSLKVHISNLRRKLREAAQKDYIEAVWGIGFKLR